MLIQLLNSLEMFGLKTAIFLERRPVVVGGMILALWCLGQLIPRSRRASIDVESGNASPQAGATDRDRGDPIKPEIFEPTIANGRGERSSAFATHRGSCDVFRRMIAVVTLMLTVSLHAASSQPTDAKVVGALASVIARKTEVEQYVKELKKSVTPPDPAYAESQRRYLAAYNLYNELVIKVFGSLTGRKGMLLIWRKEAAEIDQKTEDFTAYVSEITAGRRRSIGKLMRSATALMEATQDMQHPLIVKPSVASTLIQALTWRSWPDIN